MKTTLTILIAGLLLMATPMLSLAQGSEHRDHSGRHNNGWSDNRHGDHQYRGSRFERHRDHRMHHRMHHRDRYPRRHQVFFRPAPRYQRYVYARAPLILSPPQIVFHFGW